MVSQVWKKRWGRLRVIVRDLTLLLSAGGFALGLVMSILGAIAFWLPRETLPSDWYDALRGGGQRVDVCVGGVGLLLLIVAGYYLVDNVLKRVKFNRLINTTSRDKIVRNRDKLEELAWELSSKHKRILQRKLREMRIR